MAAALLPNCLMPNQKQYSTTSTSTTQSSNSSADKTGKRKLHIRAHTATRDLEPQLDVDPCSNGHTGLGTTTWCGPMQPWELSTMSSTVKRIVQCHTGLYRQLGVDRCSYGHAEHGSTTYKKSNNTQKFMPKLTHGIMNHN